MVFFLLSHGQKDLKGRTPMKKFLIFCVIFLLSTLSLSWGKGFFPYFVDSPPLRGFAADIPWYLTHLGVAVAQKYACGRGIWVVLPDTGVDLGNPDLRKHILTQYARNFGDPDDPFNVQDYLGHGTAMAGLVLKIAPCAKIIPLKISPGAANWFETESLREALSYTLSLLAEHPQIRVLLLSLVLEEDEGVKALLQKIYRRGVLLPAAAGNEAVAKVSFPANLFETIGVGALTEGGLPWPKNNYGPSLTLLAPGQHVLAPYLGEISVYLSGTSVASALIAGSLALLCEIFPRNALKALLETARDIKPYGYDEKSGFGDADLAEAVFKGALGQYLVFPQSLFLHPGEEKKIFFWPAFGLELSHTEGPLEAFNLRPGVLLIKALAPGEGMIELCGKDRLCTRSYVFISEEGSLAEYFSSYFPSDGNYYAIFDVQTDLLPFKARREIWLTFWEGRGFRRELIYEDDFFCNYGFCGNLLLKIPAFRLPEGIYSIEVKFPGQKLLNKDPRFRRSFLIKLPPPPTP